MWCFLPLVLLEVVIARVVIDCVCSCWCCLLLSSSPLFAVDVWFVSVVCCCGVFVGVAVACCCCFACAVY